MSWYLANEDGIIDQFASITGLKELRESSDSQPALTDFFETGATKNIQHCIDELTDVARSTKDKSVKSTATGLAKMMKGETLVSITQGFES